MYKLQWRSVTAAQEAQFATLRERRCLIEKDVQRTDRELAFFAGAENPNLRVLQDVLLTYAMFNFDLGTLLCTHCAHVFTRGLDS